MKLTQPVVSPEEWQTELEELRAKEKEQTRARDALAAARRRLPMVEFDAGYRFEGPDGPATLLDLFDGRRQLIVYHFMLDAGAKPCGGCSAFVDNMGHPAHLNARDTTLVLTSRAPQREIGAHRERMGWDRPWFATLDEDFNRACGIGGGFGLSVFVRDDEDRVYRTYFTSNRGVEALGPNWTFLDLTPLGRQEEWEDSPEGTPQTPPYQWWRYHDEY
ncbi:MAG TPA: DUF899 family protein [Thermoleophilaceae bacterium]